MAYQKLVLMFGLEHGCHLPEVEAVPLFFQQRRKKHRDDPLRDVREVEIIMPLHHSVHHPIHTEAPEREKRKPDHASLIKDPVK